MLLIQSIYATNNVTISSQPYVTFTDNKNVFHSFVANRILFIVGERIKGSIVSNKKTKIIGAKDDSRVLFIGQLTNTGNIATIFDLSYKLRTPLISGAVNPVSFFSYTNLWPINNSATQKLFFLNPRQSIWFFTRVDTSQFKSGTGNKKIELDVFAKNNGSIKTNQVLYTVEKDKNHLFLGLRTIRKLNNIIQYQIEYNNLYGVTTVDRIITLKNGKTKKGMAVSIDINNHTPLDSITSIKSNPKSDVLVQLVDKTWITLVEWNKKNPVIQVAFLFPKNTIKFRSELDVKLDSTYTGLIYKSAEIKSMKVFSNQTVVKAPACVIQPKDPSLVFLKKDVSSNKMIQAFAYYFNTNNEIVLQLEGSDFNRSCKVKDQVVVDIYSKYNKYKMSVELEETGVNSSIFKQKQIISLVKKKGDTQCKLGTGNCVFSFHTNDKLQAVILDNFAYGKLIEANVAINPSGKVFDSLTFKGVPSVSIKFKDSVNHQIKSTSVSDKDGLFGFPNLPNGSYYVSISSISQYSFPSTIRTFSSLKKINPVMDVFVEDTSYGLQGGKGVFQIDNKKPTKLFDIPMDGLNQEHMFIENKVLTPKVSLGELAKYQIVMTNRTSTPITKIQFIVWLPSGFSYYAGSGVLTNTFLEKVEKKFSKVTFFVDSNYVIQPNEKIILTYTVKPNALISKTNGLNIVQGLAVNSFSHNKLTSNLAKSYIELKQETMFSRKGLIMGRVSLHSCGDVLKKKFIGGVKLYMADGRWSVTDNLGRYSFQDVKQGIHVIKFDSMTLPEGISFKGQSKQSLTRFIDIHSGQLMQSNFEFNCDKDLSGSQKKELIQLVTTRNKAIIHEQVDLLNDMKKLLLSEDGSIDFKEKRYVSGIDDNALSRFNTKIKQQKKYIFQARKLLKSQLKQSNIWIELPNNHIHFKGIALLTSEPDVYLFIDNHLENLKGNSQVVFRNKNGSEKYLYIWHHLPIANNKLTLEVKKRVTSRFRLIASKVIHPGIKPKKSNSLKEEMPVLLAVVNKIKLGETVKPTWLWPKNKKADGRVMILSKYYFNTHLYINGKQVSEKLKGEHVIDKDKNIQSIAWYALPFQSGKNLVELKIKDEFNIERTLLKRFFYQAGKIESLDLVVKRKTIEADGESFMPVEVELKDKNGIHPNKVHKVTLQTDNGLWLTLLKTGNNTKVHSSSTIDLLVDGKKVVWFKSGKQLGYTKITAKTEKNISSVLVINHIESKRNDIFFGVGELGISYKPDSILNRFLSLPKSRFAFVFKGNFFDDLRLTANYDSHSDKNDSIKRFYPVLDSSQGGYEFKRVNNLYARLEKNNYKLTWGRSNAQINPYQNDLAKNDNYVDGLKGEYYDGTSSIEWFISKVNNKRQYEQIKPNGTATNYRLTNYPIVVNSEIIELDVLDSNHGDLPLRSTKLIAGVDYIIDDVSGYLTFNNPLSYVDKQGNLQKLRISYEVINRKAFKTLFIAGFSASHQLGNKLKVGVTYNEDSKQSKVKGFWLDYNNFPELSVVFSFARSTDKNKDLIQEKGYLQKGNAFKLIVKRMWTDRDFSSVSFTQLNSGFKNQLSGLFNSQTHLKIAHSRQLNKENKVFAEIEKDVVDNGNHQITSFGVFYESNRGDFQYKFGSRYIDHIEKKHTTNNLTGVANLTLNRSILGWMSLINLELEKALPLSNKKYKALLATDFKINDQLSAYGKLQYDNGLSVMSNNNHISFGVKADTAKNMKSYSEYRINRSQGVRDHQIVTGTGMDFDIFSRVNLKPSVEFVKTLDGNKSDDGLSLVLYLSDEKTANISSKAHIEYRKSRSYDFYHLDTSFLGQFNKRMHGLVRNDFRYTKQTSNQQSKEFINKLTVGVGYNNPYHLSHLGFYYYQWIRQLNYDASHSSTHLFSTHQSMLLTDSKSISARLACKLTLENKYKKSMCLMDYHLSFDIINKFSAVFSHGMLMSRWDDRLHSLGIGVKYKATDSLNYFVNYNFLGFKDSDLDNKEMNAKGFYLGLQFKFDESLLSNQP